jgi:glycosyltransferase involved in cell wall biosynthesis
MRVGFILAQGHMYSGGQGVYLHYLTRELARLGHDVHVVAGVPYPTVSQGVRLHRLKTFSFWGLLDGYRELAYETHPLQFFHPLNFYEFASTRASLASVMNTFSLRAYQKLNELERGGLFDVIHDNQTLGYGIWLMKERGRTVVANVHHPLAIDQRNDLAQAPGVRAMAAKLLWYPWHMQRWVAERVDKIITGSEASALSVSEALGLPREHVRVIHDGVETDAFRPLDDTLKVPLRLLFVGNTEDRNKGFRYALEALRIVRESVPARLVAVQRPRSKNAPRWAEELGVADIVTFLEGLSTRDLVREYNCAQIVISPSLYEGFGLPAAEAMACGTPIVATTAGALPEVVDNGATGLLVPPGDAPALATAISSLLGDPDSCRAMGMAGVRRVRERFTWEKTARKTVELYEELLGGRAERKAMAVAR